jgi:hypothetical protein
MKSSPKSSSKSSSKSSLKQWTYTTDYKDKNNQSFMPLMDDVISYYDKNYNFYNNKGKLLNYTVYKDDKNGIYIAKIKRKSSSVYSSRKKTSQLSNKNQSE